MRRHLRLQWYLVSLGGAFIFLSCLCSFAQKTVVHDAGPGLKQEFDYDAAGRMVESRTVGTDGKIQVKIDYSFNSHGETDKQHEIHYWPDGKSVEKIAQNTYDENSNFTSEIIEDFDQSGKHVSGHKLFHDPMSGINRCFEWKAATQKYEVIDCPASEEAHEGPEVVRQITRDEVLQSLAAARQTAEAEQKARRMQPKNPTDAALSTTTKEVAVVLPADLRPGQRISGSVVEDPERFAGHPDLLLAHVSLPMPSAGDASHLTGWTFELNGSVPQPADGPISFTVPSANPLAFTLRQAGDPSVAVGGKIDLPKPMLQKVPLAQSFESSALCFKQDLCTIAGPFTGDSHNTFVAFDKVPVKIIAQTANATYVDVPMEVVGGSATLIVAEGGKVAAMVIVVATLGLQPKHDAIQAGQDTGGAVVLENAGELADAQWRYGVFPPSTVERARALVPGFNPAKVVHQEREQREKQEKQDGVRKPENKNEESAGMILLVVRNTTPDVVSLRGATQQGYIFHLVPDSFSMGDFKFLFTGDALKAGTFVPQATAIPFLAPVKAQVFDAEPTTAKK
ncbi:MAG: hypothetical protein WAN69_17675 [Candidatus Korobacteraceae bacterium]